MVNSTYKILFFTYLKKNEKDYLFSYYKIIIDSFNIINKNKIFFSIVASIRYPLPFMIIANSKPRRTYSIIIYLTNYCFFNLNNAIACVIPHITQFKIG